MIDKAVMWRKLDELEAAVSFLQGDTDSVLAVGKLVNELKNMIERA